MSIVQAHAQAEKTGDGGGSRGSRVILADGRSRVPSQRPRGFKEASGILTDLREPWRIQRQTLTEVYRTPVSPFECALEPFSSF